MKNGFTLLELLIVIAILGVLGVIVLSAINPIEMINRARDTATLNSASEVFEASTRYHAIRSAAPWNEDVLEERLDLTRGTEILNTLVKNGEIKASFLKTSKDRLSQIYLTADSDMSFVAFCFRPKSNQFMKSYNNTYSLKGLAFDDCVKNSCYTCITNTLISDSGLAGGADSDSVASGAGTINYCANFDPERPEYPWTCNKSNKYSMYSCTNYCVGDLGCNSGCPAGQRKLTKNYYATTRGASEECGSHWQEVANAEEYCVSVASSGCDKKTYLSDPEDFEWGCTNPQRPYKWK